jgi:hypothetical protein
LSSRKGERNNEKEDFNFGGCTVAFCVGFHSASASLLGMSLNLMVAIKLIEADAPRASWQFFTDDVLTGPLLVKRC